MPIIDFLLDNLFFVIIVLGFLSSIIAKNKNAGQENQRENYQGNQTYDSNGRTGNRNPTLDHRVERPLENPMERPANRTVERPLERNAERPIQRSMERTYEKVAVKVEPTFIEINDAVRKEIQQKKDQIASESPIYAEDLLAKANAANRSKDKSAFLSKDESMANQAIQGMMWSEIFGPPRASKPFRPGSYRK